MNKEKKSSFLSSAPWCKLFQLKWLKRLLVGLLLTVVLLWAGAFLVFHFYVQPRTELYQEQAEQWFEQEVGGKLSIDKIDARWHTLAPEVTLYGIKIQDVSAIKPPLELKSIVLEPSWWSLFTFSPRFKYVGIESPDLAIIRNKEGLWSINGIVFDKTAEKKNKSNTKVLNLLLQQKEVEINQANISFEDQFLSWPKLELKDGHFYYQKNTLNQKINLQGKLDDNEQIFDFNVSWRGDDVENWRQWQGEADARIINDKKSSLARYVGSFFQKASLDGSLNASIKFSNAKLDEFKVLFDLTDVEITDKQGYQLRLPKLGGETHIWQEGKQHYFFQAKKINLLTQEGEKLNNGVLKGDMVLGASGFGQLEMDQINLSALYPILGLIGAQQNPVFKELAIKGQVNNLVASWKGDTLKPHSIKLKSEFVNLSWLASGDIPGLDRVSGTIHFDQKAGKLALNGKNVRVNLATLYNEPILLDRLEGVLNIDLLDNGIRLGFEKVKTENKDIKQVELDGAFTHFFKNKAEKPDDILDVNVKAQSVEATTIKLLLPNIMKPKSRYWLEHAFLAGGLENISAKIKGTPKKFPFVNGEGGQFDAKADVNQLELLFSPDWPTLKNLKGNIVFKNADISINGKEGSSERLKAKNTQVVIHNLKDLENMWMDVDAQINGSLDDFLMFTHKTPIVKWTGGFVKEIKGVGAANMNLKIKMPLQHVKDAQVWAGLKLNNNTISFGHNTSIPQLDNTFGVLTFTEKGVEAKDVKAKAYGGWLKMSASSSQKEKGTHFAISGQIETQKLLSFYWPESPTFAKGISQYQANFLIQKGLKRLNLSSDLAGTQWLIPIESIRSKPLDLALKPTNQSGWRIDARFGKNNNSYFDIQNGQLTSAALSFGGVSLPRTTRGIHISANENKIDLESFFGMDLTPHLGSKGKKGNSTQKTLPITFTLDSEHFRFAEVDYGKATLRGKFTQGQTIEVFLRSSMASGKLRYDLTDKNKFDLHLSSFYFNIDKKAPTTKENTTASAQKCFPVEKMPHLTVLVDQFYLDKQNYGVLSFTGQPNLQGYQINNLNLKHPNAKMLGKIQLITQNNACAQLKASFNLESQDFGAWLTKLDLSKQLDGGQAQIDGNIDFSSVEDLRLANMNGYVKLRLKDGRFVNVQPGMGRVLGLFDVSMLAKRITLNFKDVFLPGLSFDSIQTEGNVKKGILSLQNFNMNAAGIKGKMNGQINLSTKTLNTRLSVYSNLTHGIFSTIKEDASLRASQELGLTSDETIGSLIQMPRQSGPLTKNFHISGKWGDPTIVKQ